MLYLLDRSTNVVDIGATMIESATPNASRSANNRSRTTNDPRRVRGVDGRSAIMRRRRDLIGMYVAALGNQITDRKMVEIVRAADLVAACETQRALSLRGQPVDVLALVRLENLAARAVKALGIKTDEQSTETLSDYLDTLADEATP
jgi:hypothetical protein